MSVRIEMKILQRNVEKLVNNVVDTDLTRRAENVKQELEKLAPVADGSNSYSDGSPHLRDSFRVGTTIDHGKKVIRIFSDKLNDRGEPIIKIITGGSKPHVIRGNPMLVFKGIPSGGLIFTHEVQHPGTAPNHFVEEALNIGFHRRQKVKYG